MQGGAGDMGAGVNADGSAKVRAGVPVHKAVGGTVGTGSFSSSRWDTARAQAQFDGGVGASLPSDARALWFGEPSSTTPNEEKGYLRTTRSSTAMATFAPRGIPAVSLTPKARKLPLPPVRSGSNGFNKSGPLPSRKGHPDFTNPFDHVAGPLGDSEREINQFTVYEQPRYLPRAGYTGGRSHYKTFKHHGDHYHKTKTPVGPASAALPSSLPPTPLPLANARELPPPVRTYDMPVPSDDPFRPNPVVAVHNVNAVGKRKAAGERKHRGTSRNVLGGFYTS